MNNDVNNNVIELIDIRKTYLLGEVSVPALRGIDLNIQEGRMYAIIGPSGSGKSTLMNMVGLLDTPTSGKVLIDGRDVASFDEDELAEVRGKKIGFVFQLFNLIPTLTALENVELPMVFQQVDEQERKKRAMMLLKTVGLEDRAEHKPRELSGGQQQRVAIARALVMDPPIILADEPTGNLDSKTSVEIMNLFEELHEKHAKTIVLITHDNVIADYAHIVVKIKDGVIAEERKNGKKER